MFWTAVHARNPELRYFRRTGENHRVDGRSATSANRNLVDRARKAVFDGDPIADGQVLAVPLNAVEFDFLIRATVSLHQIVQAAPGLLPDDLAQIAAGWETSTFPATPLVPDGDFDLETFVALEAGFKVLQQS